MFEKIYLSVDSKVVPDKKLIDLTKEKMYEEIKNKKDVRNINFYKYATIAACIVIFISVIGIIPKNVGNLNNACDNLKPLDSFEKMDGMQSTDSISKIDNINGNFNNYFSGDVGALADLQEDSSILSHIKNFIEGIIQWFYELLF